MYVRKNAHGFIICWREILKTPISTYNKSRHQKMLIRLFMFKQECRPIWNCDVKTDFSVLGLVELSRGVEWQKSLHMSCLFSLGGLHEVCGVCWHQHENEVGIMKGCGWGGKVPDTGCLFNITWSVYIWLVSIILQECPVGFSCHISVHPVNTPPLLPCSFFPSCVFRTLWNALYWNFLFCSTWAVGLTPFPLPNAVA